MPQGGALLLGQTLLNYVHRLTRLVRNLLYIDGVEHPDDDQIVIIGPTRLTNRQIDQRKYLMV